MVMGDRQFLCELREALIIKEKSKLPDEELMEYIRESPHLQYFLGLKGIRISYPLIRA